MDESWRIPMGMSSTGPTIPRRKSTERPLSGEPTPLDPEDFDDVFGGPPRTVISRQFSRGGDTHNNLSYDHIFRKPERFVSPAKTGRNLPEFRIPVAGGRCEEFYVDVFGNEESEKIVRSRSRSKSKTTNSKSNSSSVLSSEEFIGEEDAPFPVFASKLRPINVPSRWKTSAGMHNVLQQKPGMPDNSCSRPSVAENEHVESLKNTNSGFARRVSSPETTTIGPNSYNSFKESVDHQEVNSPSSVVSSVCQEQQYKTSKVHDEILQEEEEDDEVMSSYVIEINAGDDKERTDKVRGVDEAIEWAKGKFQCQSSLKDGGIRQPEKHVSTEMPETPAVSQFTDAQLYGYTSFGLQLKEMALLDEDIRLWSSGKKRNIQLLISTLHDILWPSSGWCQVPLSILSDSSNLIKAYQKARLCLHPAKLQQRGANLPQKYIAEKALSILQEAWATYTSQDNITTRA